MSDNSMELAVGDVTYAFRRDPVTSRYVSPITLVEWEPFRSTNTVPGREGQRVLLECPMVYDERDEEELAEPFAYARSLEYFLNHRLVIQENILAACLTFVQDLHAFSVKYEAEMVELAHVATVEHLRSLIDLSYVHLFPYQRDGLPYIGFDLEANWNEHGVLALLHGTEVLACSYPGTERAVDYSIRDDGGVR
jgi:hypothetical protein